MKIFFPSLFLYIFVLFFFGSVTQRVYFSPNVILPVCERATILY